MAVSLHTLNTQGLACLERQPVGLFSPGLSHGSAFSGAWVFRGVGLTGRVIHVTMGLPAVLIIILIGRGTSLPNASEGIKLYFATWRTSALQGPKIWQDALGQIFFSIGFGFGYFTSWASYCSQHSNAAQDAMIISFNNSMEEIIAAFSVFGVIG